MLLFIMNIALVLFGVISLRLTTADDVLNDAETISRICSVFCSGPILEGVQMAQIFDDSKTFVDMPLLVDPEDALAAWSSTFTITEIENFVSTYFSDPGSELISAVPKDWKEEPYILSKITNNTWSKFAYDLNQIWLTLYREMDTSVFNNPQRYSILRRRNGLVLPGGRFRETYYWDSYWIIRGLIICDMKDTAQGVVQNLLDDVNDFGFVPNGGRAYYTNRSQPPFLSLMVKDVTKAQVISSTSPNDKDDDDKDDDNDWLSFLSNALPLLEIELSFWENQRNVKVCGNLSQYYSDSTQPRPESYVEDVATAETSIHEDIYSQLCAGAETGWDFSSRWIIPDTDQTTSSIQTKHSTHKKTIKKKILNKLNKKMEHENKVKEEEEDDDDIISSLYFELSNISTSSIVPIDLNSILYRSQLALAWLYELKARQEGGVDDNHSYEEDVETWLKIDERCLIDIYNNMNVEPGTEKIISSSSFSMCHNIFKNNNNDDDSGEVEVELQSNDAISHIKKSLIRRQAIEEFLWIPKEGKWSDGLLSWNNSKLNHYYNQVDDDNEKNNNNDNTDDKMSEMDVIKRRSSGDICSPILKNDYNNVNSLSSWSTPLWAGLGNNLTLNEKNILLNSLSETNLIQIGGVQTTVIGVDQGGQQWDSPNAWAPLQMMLIHGLEAIGEIETSNLLASHWLTSNLKGWDDGSGNMFEKYDAFHPGEYGGGGEYEPQSGFGWTNGVALELIERNYAIDGSTL